MIDVLGENEPTFPPASAAYVKHVFLACKGKTQEDS